MQRHEALLSRVVVRWFCQPGLVGKKIIENIGSNEFGPPQNHPNSSPDPDPAQEGLWEALGQPLEGLEEVLGQPLDGKNVCFDEKALLFTKKRVF